MAGAADDAAEAPSGDRLVPAMLTLLAACARQVLEGLSQESGDLQQHETRQHLDRIGTVCAAWVDGCWRRETGEHM